MEKTDKSAEEIDERLLVKRIWQRAYLDTEESHVMLIRDYAAQQLSEYKEVIKELLPIAERMQSACESGETLCYDNDLDLSDAKNYKSIIDRAKALLQESSQDQPPQESEQP